MSVFCQHCGAKNDDGFVFCASCGQKQDVPAQPAPATSSPPAPAPVYTPPLAQTVYAPPPAAAKSGKGFVILVVFLIAAAAAVYLYRDRLKGLALGALPGWMNNIIPADTGAASAVPVPRATTPATTPVQTMELLEDETDQLEDGKPLYAPGSNNPFTGTLIVRYRSGNKRGEVAVVNGIPAGALNGWYENGQKKEEGIYRNGKQEGIWTLWDEYGNQKTVIYRDGQEISPESNSSGPTAVDRAQAEYETAEARYQRAFEAYTTLVTSDASGNVEEALQEYKDATSARDAASERLDAAKRTAAP